MPATGEIAVTYDRKNEEYMADFVVIAKRTLDERDLKLFRFHFVLGADWKMCCRRLGLDRGGFFHALYRIQQKLGKAFRETLPYPLFPVYEYLDEVRQPAASLVDNPQQNTQNPPGQRLVRKLPRTCTEAYPGQQPGRIQDSPSVGKRKIA